jgi:hypothetical protein
MTATGSDVSYEPYDFEIDSDPYPVWKRWERLPVRVPRGVQR